MDLVQISIVSTATLSSPRSQQDLQFVLLPVRGSALRYACMAWLGGFPGF
jgi:hypothetical protein